MKVFAWIIGILVLAVIAVAGYIAFNSGSLIKQAIEETGPSVLGADVSVDAVNLSLAEGSAQIRQLTLGNPAGFAGDHAMRLGEIKVVIDPAQISEQLIVVKQVLIDSADLAVIARGRQTNFQQLMQNVEDAVGASSGSETSGGGSGGPKFIIERLDFTNATASLASDVLGNVGLDIPDIHLTDIGRASNGATAAQIAEQVLKPVTAAVTREAVNKGLDLEGVKQRATEKVRESIREKLGDGLRGLTDKLKTD